MPEITINLTEEEWSEVANAVDTKLARVRRGDYGPEDNPGDDEKWALTLQSALGKISTALDAADVTW